VRGGFLHQNRPDIELAEYESGRPERIQRRFHVARCIEWQVIVEVRIHGFREPLGARGEKGVRYLRVGPPRPEAFDYRKRLQPFAD
jgi:hypothetical protein